MALVKTLRFEFSVFRLKFSGYIFYIVGLTGEYPCFSPGWARPRGWLVVSRDYDRGARYVYASTLREYRLTVTFGAIHPGRCPHRAA